MGEHVTSYRVNVPIYQIEDMLIILEMWSSGTVDSIEYVKLKEEKYLHRVWYQ